MNAFAYAASTFEAAGHHADWWRAPVTWATDVLGVDLAPYQADELDALAQRGRVAVRGPRGSGKTTPAALAILWFACTREAAGVDWKVVSTAGSWDQLTRYLWPEVHKWARRIRWEVAGIPRWQRGSQLLDRTIKLEHGQAFGRASDDPDLIEGAHAEHLLVVVDEGKSVVDDVWDAIEGFFANPGEHYALALSTPGAPTGRFYDIHARKAGFEDWHTVHVTLEQAVKAGRVSASWAEQRRVQWGADSQLFRCHVLAEFAGDPDGVIPLAWVEAAMERHKAGRDGPVTHIGADIGDTGEDDTVLAVRSDWRVCRLERFDHGSVLDHADRIAARIGDGTAIVDGIGVGAGTVAQLRRLQVHTSSFIAGAATKRKDRSGEVAFNNCRSAAWWNLRELLDPSGGEPIELPDDDLLLGDLTAPTWREVAGGKIQVESKDDIRKRLRRSTDAGDAVVQAFWSGGPDMRVGGLHAVDVS